MVCLMKTNLSMDNIFILISGIISLFAIISLFIMASNISYIKDYIKSKFKPDWYGEYLKRKYLKRADAEILFAAQEFIWAEIMKNKSIKKYDELEGIWSGRFTTLGGEFPEYPFK